MTDIARLRELLAAATPGRWIAGAVREDGTAQVYCPHRGLMRVIVPVAETEPHNAALIAELRNALPDLLDEAERLRMALSADLSRANRDAMYRHDLMALVADGAKDGCHTDVGTALRKRLVQLQTEADKIGRSAGCLCHWEQGDSPCPVHGGEEET